MKKDEKKNLLESIIAKTTETFKKLGASNYKVVEMSRLEKLIEFKKTGDENLKPEKFEDVMLEDGMTMMVIEPAIEPGAAAVMKTKEGEPVAAPTGEYILQDGRTVVVEPDGVVKEVRDAAAGEGEDGLEKEPAAGVSPADDKIKRIIERIETEKIFEKAAKVDELEKLCEFLKKENETLKAEFVSTQTTNNEAFKKLLSEPSQEPAQSKKNAFSDFKTEGLMEAYLNKFGKDDE